MWFLHDFNQVLQPSILAAVKNYIFNIELYIKLAIGQAW